MKKKTQTLAIYLMKAGIFEENILKEDTAFLIAEEIKLSGNTIGKLYVKHLNQTKPKWVNLFEEADKKILQTLITTSVSAVFLIKVTDRWFALTFGSGRYILNENAIEERFGLLVCLNSISGISIRSVDKQTIDSMGKHTREQASIDADIDEFTIDPEQDLLRAITGKPSIDFLGSRLSGSDALNAAVKTNLASLPNLCEEYLKKYKEDTYKKEYDWVDNISPVKNGSLCAILDGLLIDKVKIKNEDKIWMAIPEIIDWTLTGGFSFTPKEQDLHSDILLADCLNSLDKEELITIDLLKRKFVFCRNVDGDGIYKQWHIYKCIYCEIDLDKSKYLLTNGKWYKVEIDFLQKVNDFIKSIPESSVKLPDCVGMKEGEYNTSVSIAYPDQYTKFDADNIQYGGGRSKIEFCDLYSKDRQIIHVKKYSGSDVLSHLFAQGAVAGEIFLTDIEFRKRIDAKLPDSMKLESLLSNFDARKFRIIYCVISKKGLCFELPFFSKVSLRHSIKRLEAFGYKVELKKIEYTE